MSLRCVTLLVLTLTACGSVPQQASHPCTVLAPERSVLGDVQRPRDSSAVLVQRTDHLDVDRRYEGERQVARDTSSASEWIERDW